MAYDKFCFEKQCPEYIEWEYSEMGHSIQCISCKLMGQSYNITHYPEDCVFKKEIQEFSRTITQ